MPLPAGCSDGSFVVMNIQAGAVTREKPPFRAEHIGSLLRPKALLDQRGRFARGEILQADLTAAEDAAISGAVALQERLGLRFATDGEFRRRSYHSFFYQQLGDLSIDTVAGADARGAPSGGGRGAQPIALINSRVRWTHPINVADFNFLKSKTKLLPKITIPGPCALHFRGGNAAVLTSAYRDVEQFWDDTVEAFNSELTALAEAGCRYIQIDETAFAKFGDPDIQAALAARGDDWSKLIDAYIAITNRVLRAAPNTLHIGMHLCRGNRGGHWHAEGSYEDVAERLFNTLEISSYFLEFDTSTRGHFYAAAFRSQTQIGRARIDFVEDAGAGGQGGLACAGGGGEPPCLARPPGGEPTMRLRQRRHRQSGDASGAGS